jgi:hypothetical protein
VISGEGDDTSWGGSMRRFADGIVLPKINQLANLGIETEHFGAHLNFFADSPFLAFYLSRKEALSGTTKRICHKCDCTSANKAQWFSVNDDNCQWRAITTDELLQQRKRITDATQPGLPQARYNEASKDTGLNRDDDAFEGVPWWDSTKAAWNDWMHGEPEGPCKDHEYLLIHNGVLKGYFSVQKFCQLVHRFPFLIEDGAFVPRKTFKSNFFTSKKPNKKLGSCLKLTGSQALQFGLALPGILWDHYDRTDPHWKCFCDHMLCVAWAQQDSFLRFEQPSPHPIPIVFHFADAHVGRSQLPIFEKKQATWRQQYFELYGRQNPLIHQGCHLTQSIEEAGPPNQRYAFR